MRFARADDVIEQELDGQFLLLRSGTADVLHLDTVASDVWRLLEEPASRDELATELAAAYDVEAGRVAADLGPALDVLVTHGVAVLRADD